MLPHFRNLFGPTTSSDSTKVHLDDNTNDHPFAQTFHNITISGDARVIVGSAHGLDVFFKQLATSQSTDIQPSSFLLQTSEHTNLGGVAMPVLVLEKYLRVVESWIRLTCAIAISRLAYGLSGSELGTQFVTNRAMSFWNHFVVPKPRYRCFPTEVIACGRLVRSSAILRHVSAIIYTLSR